MKSAFFQPRFFMALACAISRLAWADDQRDAALLDDLLKLATPPVDWREQLGQPDAPRENAPSADAPIETLADFWIHAPDNLKPDPGIPPRLLSWCEAHPENLIDLLRWMPTDGTEYHDRLKHILDRLVVRLRTQRRWHDTALATYEWLMRHSRYYRPEFLAEIRQEFSGIDGEAIARDIQGLGRVDSKAAEKLLLQISKSRDPFARTAALVWLHTLHLAAPGDPRLLRWRSELQKIAADPSAPIRARDYAVMGTMRVRWEGEDEWFLNLFGEAPLGVLKGNGLLLRPLLGVARTEPDRWIPKIIPLAASSNPAVRNNAVRCLCEFTCWRARADALRALLPWVSDPHWAELGSETPRENVVEGLADVSLPESVPRLLQVVERENGRIIERAARALVHYRAKEAAPALRAAIARVSLLDQAPLVTAAIELGAYSDDEMELAIQALLHQLATDQKQAKLESFDPEFSWTSPDAQVRLGVLLWRAPIESDELVKRLLRASEELLRSERKSAESLLIMIAGWKGGAAMESIARQLESGKLTTPWIAQLLAHREERAAELAIIKGLHGVSRGVQVACTGDADQAGSVLGGRDRSAQVALLACARHLRLPLPVDSIAPLLDAPDADLSRAAEDYLTGRDDPASRAIVLRHHPNEARNVGATQDYSYDLDSNTSGPITDAERLMRERVLAHDGPGEILGLLSEGFPEDDGQRLVLVYADRTVLRWLDGGGRHRERTVPAGEIARLRGWLHSTHADDLVLYDGEGSNGIRYEYVHLDRNGGRRVFMIDPLRSRRYAGIHSASDPTFPDPSIYARLVDQFSDISRSPMEVVYESTRTLPGFRLLHPREHGKALGLSRNPNC